MDLKIADLKNKVGMSGEMKNMQDMINNLNREINELCGDMDENENTIKGVVKNLNAQLSLTTDTLKEMKNGALLEGGDYWDHRKQIEKNATIINNAKIQMTQIKEKLSQNEAMIVKVLTKRSEAANNPEVINQICKELQGIKDEMENLLNEGYDIKDTYNEIAKEMDDCYIPVMIKTRANEVSFFIEKLHRLMTEFDDLKKADDEFEGTEESEADIKEVIRLISKDIAELDKAKSEFVSY